MCLKFEMRHQLLKRIAKATNFKGLGYSVAHHMDMHAAIGLAHGKHLDFNRIRLDATLEEKCCYGQNPIIDQLFLSGALPRTNEAHVTWGRALLLSTAKSLPKGSWMLVTHTGNKQHYLLEVLTYFQILDVIFLHGQPYPSSLLVKDQLYSSWSIPRVNLDSPQMQPQSIPVNQLRNINQLHRFSPMHDALVYFTQR